MTSPNEADLLYRAFKHAESLGEIILQHVPAGQHVILFAALRDHLETTLEKEPERIVRVFEAGLVTGINNEIKTGTRPPPVSPAP